MNLREVCTSTVDFVTSQLVGMLILFQYAAYTGVTLGPDCEDVINKKNLNYKKFHIQRVWNFNYLTSRLFKVEFNHEPCHEPCPKSKVNLQFDTLNY